MKKGLTIFLQVIVLIIGVSVLAFMLWEPHLEGANVNATFFEMYFKDPFLAYVYLSSIPFFVILYKTFKILPDVYSPANKKSFRTIRNCALATIGLILGAEAYIMTVVRRVEEDTAGGVAMGLFAILIFTVIASTAAIFEKNTQSALIKN